MILQLNFHTFYGTLGDPLNGQVEGLYVYTAQSDILTLSWNNSPTVHTPIWNNTLSRYEFTTAGLPKGGSFILTQNGIVKSYGYTSANDDSPPATNVYGNNSSILECETGNYWFTNDLDFGTLNMPESSNVILSINPNATGEVFPSFRLDGTAYQGIQHVYDLGPGFVSGNTDLFEFKAYTNPGMVFDSTYGTFPHLLPSTTACPTCQAGDNAPFLNPSYSTSCPSQTFNLSTLSPSNLLSGSTLEFHNSNIVNNSTLLSSLLVSAGTYYAVFHSTNPVDCYSAVHEITIINTVCCNAGVAAPILSTVTNTLTNVCPAATVSLSSITASNTPVNTVLEWHSASVPTSLTLLSNVSTLGVGIYYATFHDTVNNCYSPTTSFTVTIHACAIANDDFFTTDMNTPLTANVSLNDTLCNCIAMVSILPNIIECLI